MIKTVQILIIIAYLLRVDLAFAGIGKDMKQFWHEMGGIQNSGGMSSYQAQSAGYYTMGGIYARTPVRNTQIASVNMPSMKAGCGGINLHNGSFSFLNGEEINRTLKAIANNSTAFATQLALETMSPVIAEKVEEMHTWMQRINAMNINSCETAASLVGGMWPKHERASQTICSTLANNSGITSDFAKARHECYANASGTRDKIRNKNPDTYDKLGIDDINLAWKAIKDAGFLDMQDPDDYELAQLFMTLSGTIIIKAYGDTPKYEFISGRAGHNDIIKVLMEGGEIKYHRCKDKEKCLDVTKEGAAHNIKVQSAFKTKVEKIILSILEKIKMDEELSLEEKNFLNYQTNIPLYKILNVHAAHSGAASIFELQSYIEVIALQMLFEYLNDVVRQVEIASDNLIIASEDHLSKYRENLKHVKMSLKDREIKTHNTFSTVLKLVDRTQVLEGIMANQLGSPMGETFKWSKNN